MLSLRLPLSASSASSFEKLFRVGGPVFCESFFDVWPANIVLVVGRVSFFMSSAIRGYVFSRWNPRTLLTRWIYDVSGFLSILEDSGSVVCGPAVTRFFSRAEDVSSNLDICVPREAFGGLVEFLRRELYSHSSGEQFSSLFRPLIRYRVFGFVFRGLRHRDHTVTVHIVCGDPIRFLITCCTTNAMNLITSRRAISTFPLTTFIRHEFVRSAQQDAYSSSMERIVGVLRGVGECSDMTGSDVVPCEMERERRVGDGKCWSIPFTVCDGLPYEYVVPEGPVFRIKFDGED